MLPVGATGSRSRGRLTWPAAAGLAPHRRCRWPSPAGGGGRWCPLLVTPPLRISWPTASSAPRACTTWCSSTTSSPRCASSTAPVSASLPPAPCPHLRTAHRFADPKVISQRAAAARHCSHVRGAARCTSLSSRHAGEPLEVGTAAPHRCDAGSKHSSFVYDDESPAAVHLLAPQQSLDCAPAAAAGEGDASQDDEGTSPEGARRFHIDRQLFRSAAEARLASTAFSSQVPLERKHKVDLSRLTLFAASAISEHGTPQIAEQFENFLSSNALAVLVSRRNQGLGIERQLTALCWRGQAQRSGRRRRASWRASPPAPPRPWGRRPPCCCCGPRAGLPGRAPACFSPDAASPVLLLVALAMASPEDDRTSIVLCHLPASVLSANARQGAERGGSRKLQLNHRKVLKCVWP